jgi:hypothetical protein
MDIILFLLYVSVYLSIGSIMAELSLDYHDREKLDVVTQRKTVYVFITALWPLCVIIFLYQSFTLGGK